MKTINLQFKGYWLESGISSIPKESGVYVVYQCEFNKSTDKVSIERRIYIGESKDVNDRIDDHEKWDEWRDECASGKVICFSSAPISNPDRERAEAALIFKHKSPVNVEYKNSFPFEDTRMKLNGKCNLLNKDFTVKTSK